MRTCKQKCIFPCICFAFFLGPWFFVLHFPIALNLDSLSNIHCWACALFRRFATRLVRLQAYDWENPVHRYKGLLNHVYLYCHVGRSFMDLRNKVQVQLGTVQMAHARAPLRQGEWILTSKEKLKARPIYDQPSTYDSCHGMACQPYKKPYQFILEQGLIRRTWKMFRLRFMFMILILCMCTLSDICLKINVNKSV